MNLPLEYTKLSEYFDALGCASSDLVNDFIEKILKKYSIKTILDLTCGTGSQLIYLAKHGYKVTGSDISLKLLKIAQKKLKAENLKAKLLQGDMRTKQIGQFDAVITIFNAIGHLSKKDFEKTIKNIYKNLNNNGLYIFDIFNLNSLNKNNINSFTMDNIRIIKNKNIRQIQYSVINKKTGQLTSYDQFFMPKIIKSKFTLQIYTAKELREMLEKNGFEVLGQYELDGSKFSDKTSREILTVARKHA